MTNLSTSSIELNNSTANSGELALCLLEIFNANKSEKLLEIVIEGSENGTEIPFPNIFQFVNNESYNLVLTNVTPFDSRFDVNLTIVNNLTTTGAVVGALKNVNGDSTDNNQKLFGFRLSEGNTIQFLFENTAAYNVGLKLAFVEVEVEGEFTKSSLLSENGNVIFPANGFNYGEIPNNQFFLTTTGWLWPNPWYTQKKVCSVNVENVLNCFEDGGEYAGIGQYINFIGSNDVLVMQQAPPINEYTTNEGYVSVIGYFVYVAGKKFTRFQTLPDSRMFDLTSEGTIGQLSPRSQLVFRLPNSRAALGVLKKIANTPGIVVFSNGTNDKVILGTKIFPAKIASFTTKQSETESYIEITITSGTKWPMYYSGNL